jgi:hypothetical protein
MGSSIAITDWKYNGASGAFEGTLYGIPDRGWNTNGTVNYASRVHKFSISLTLAPNASISNPSAPNLAVTYLDSILLKGPDGELCTGLDASASGKGLTYPGFPVLPTATYTGDGFGGSGNGGQKIAIDAEGLVLDKKDGGFWISDEYGPYIYKFDAQGNMKTAIAPPNAILPLRNGAVR